MGFSWDDQEKNYPARSFESASPIERRRAVSELRHDIFWLCVLLAVLLAVLIYAADTAAIFLG